MYMDALYRSAGATSRLISPWIQEKNCLQFYYYMYGSTMGEFEVFLQKNGSFEQLIWHLEGQQGPHWFEALVPLQVENSESFKVVNCFTTNKLNKQVRLDYSKTFLKTQLKCQWIQVRKPCAYFNKYFNILFADYICGSSRRRLL